LADIAQTGVNSEFVGDYFQQWINMDLVEVFLVANSLWD